MAEKKVFKFAKGTASGPMKRAAVEIDQDKLDEILLAFYIHQDRDSQPADIEKGLVKYRQAPPETKAGTLQRVLAELQETLSFLQQVNPRLGLSTPALTELKKGEEDPIPILQYQCEYLERKIAILTGTPEESLPVASNPVSTTYLEGIWAGGPKYKGKNKWRPSKSGDTYEMQKSGIGKQGKVVLWVDPKVEAERAALTLEQVEKYLEGLSPFTADVALCVLAALSDARRGPLEGTVEIDARKIIEMKGINAWGKQRDALEVAIEREMKNLEQLKFNIYNLPSSSPETGKYNPDGYSWRGDQLFNIVEATQFQQNIFGEQEQVAIQWVVRAGIWASYFLLPSQRRWVCGMAKRLLTLSHRKDRRVEVLAKKIGQYVYLQKGVRLPKGQPLEWTIGTLCKLIGEDPLIEQKPRRLKEAFQEAVQLLVDHGVFSAAQYSPGYEEDIGWAKGWKKKWVEYTVTFTLPEENEITSYLQAAQRPQALPPARTRKHRKTPPGEAIDGREIRTVREERGVMQEDLARLVGVSRPYLSDIENGKRLPSPELARKIKDWLQDRKGRYS